MQFVALLTDFHVGQRNLAEHHGLPCLALASFPLSTISTPSGFSIMFSQEYPRFYDLLSNSRPPYLTKADLRSWMWKTFLDDAAEFRELMGASTLVPFEDIIVDIENEDSKELPMATRVVSTVSLELAKLVDRKLDLESLNVEYVGLFPPLPTPTSCESAISAFLESLDSTLKESDAPLILVYFGSMTRLSRHLLDSDSVLKLARTIEEASSGLSTPAKIVWIGEGPIAEALRPAGTLVVQLPPHFAFPALVSHLKQKHAKIVTITHGGSGTVQSLLQFGGIRQICVPLRFDQSKWADAVEELEAGKKVDVESSAEEWKKAMEDCLKLEPPTTVGGTGSGLEKALELVSELMASSFSVPKS